MTGSSGILIGIGQRLNDLELLNRILHIIVGVCFCTPLLFCKGFIVELYQNLRSYEYLRASGTGGGGTSGTDGNGDLENGGFRGSECVDGRETYVYQGI